MNTYEAAMKVRDIARSALEALEIAASRTQLQGEDTSILDEMISAQKEAHKTACDAFGIVCDETNDGVLAVDAVSEFY